MSFTSKSFAGLFGAVALALAVWGPESPVEGLAEASEGCSAICSAVSEKCVNKCLETEKPCFAKCDIDFKEVDKGNKRLPHKDKVCFQACMVKAKPCMSVCQQQRAGCARRCE